MSKNAKSAKKNVPDEKITKPQPSTMKKSYDLPALRCKNTLLLDYDYSKEYSKRHVVSNWDKYAELPDDDDDENGQLSAADFEQLLSASKSIGDHFTFATERTWLQSDDDRQSNESSMASDLFTLNISHLKNGISRLPFYMRQGMSSDMFTPEEITNMNCRANYFDNETSSKSSATNPMNQSLLNILTSNTSSQAKKNANNMTSNLKNPINATPKAVEAQTSIDVELAQSLETTQLIDDKHTIVKTPVTTPTPSKFNPNRQLVSDTVKVKSNKTEDIQDWLDDILNEN